MMTDQLKELLDEFVEMEKSIFKIEMIVAEMEADALKLNKKKKRKCLK